MSDSAEPTQQTTWRKLRKTPLRDLLRLRLTGRLDVDRLLAEAQLPERLAELVRSVVSRTRLWRMEKSDVTRELISHFREGLEAGATAEALAQDFGEAKQAAKLIRRARKRNRPAPLRALVRTMQATGAVLALLVVLYGVQAVRVFTAKPVISVNYYEKLVADVRAIPPEDRGWPIYLEAFLRLENLPDLGTNRNPRPGERGWKEIEEYLLGNAEALALLREAASKPAMGFVPGDPLSPKEQKLWPYLDAEKFDSANMSLHALRLPHIGATRRARQMLDLDTQRAAAIGDGDAVAANVRDMLLIGAHIREIPTLYNDLVALGIRGGAVRTLTDVLANRPELFTESDLHHLAHELSSLGQGYALIHLDSHRYFFHDTIQRFFSNDGAGDGYLLRNDAEEHLTLIPSAWPPAPESWIDAPTLPLVSVVSVGRRELVRKHDELIAMHKAWASQPPWQRGRSAAQEEIARIESGTITSIRYRAIMILMPVVYDVVIHSEDIFLQQRDAALTLIALELYRRRHGDWPATLDLLVPDLLPQVPRDRFDGGPIKYRLSDAGPILYSVGTNRIDNGGRMPYNWAGRPDPTVAQRWIPPEQLDDPNVDVPDGDWILYPPYIEPLKFKADDEWSRDLE